MSGCAADLAGVEKSHTTLKNVIDYISRFQWPNSPEPPEWARKDDEEVDDCVSVIKQLSKSNEQDLHYYSRRIDIQLTAVSYINPLTS